MKTTSEFFLPPIGEQFGRGLPNSRAKQSAQTSSLLPAAAWRPVSQADIATGALDVRKEALKRFQDSLTAKLEGPDARPVFVPENDPQAQNYRGLLLVPHGWSKTAQKG